MTKKPYLLGLLQAGGVIIYCIVIATFMTAMNQIMQTQEEIIMIATMLVLLVFSAAVTGSLVFGYPAYLAMQKKLKAAITLLGFTFLYFLGAIIIAVLILACLPQTV